MIKNDKRQKRLSKSLVPNNFSTSRTAERTCSRSIIHWGLPIVANSIFFAFNCVIFRQKVISSQKSIIARAFIESLFILVLFHILDSGFWLSIIGFLDTIKAKNKVKLLIPSSTSHHKQDRTEGMTIIKWHAKKTFLLQFLESLWVVGKSPRSKRPILPPPLQSH